MSENELRELMLKNAERAGFFRGTLELVLIRSRTDNGGIFIDAKLVKRIEDALAKYP